MDDAGGMGPGQSVGDLDGVPQGCFQLEAAAADEAVEGGAVHIFHDDEIDALIGGDVVDDDDVGMVESRSRLGFQDEASLALGIGGFIGRQDLDRYDPVEVGVRRLVDDAHAAFADLLRDVVMKQALADHTANLPTDCFPYKTPFSGSQAGRPFSVRSCRSASRNR